MTNETTELDELLDALAVHRGLLRRTVRDITDEQAVLRPTASELSLGGIIKHVANTEERWVRFVVAGPDALEASAAWADDFRLLDGETLAGELARYDEVAAETEKVFRSLPDLGASQPLPQAPWFPPNARRSARRVLVHLVAETSQHAGHADIIRESIDGAKTMG
ncbi:DinB family protein [Actinomadura rayongensis]|uniref:DUF664 domain-containing protein n=1 Tax=Actinomadura rayongensis TaxID=1429076 RepID=A0A6I4WI14_9ACTN|nr:DinB family protein [Actinomadura rayongensis]MXQ66634.1 DUF664 domain-containing protein [Actinomadura rayongensis]